MEELLLRHVFERQYEAGKASRVILPFALKPKMRVLIKARKSGRERGNNLCEQVANLRDVVEGVGAIVVGVLAYTGSGFDSWTGATAVRAKRLGADVILAETTDRFVRNRSYHSKKRPMLQATERELAQLARDADGVPLMAHLHPDATPGEVRSYHTKRGQRYKGRKGGRPAAERPGYKKQRFNQCEERAFELYQFHYSLDSIAERLGVSRSTVWDWIQRRKEISGF